MKKYTCNNFSECEQADSFDSFELGTHEDRCPKCGRDDTLVEDINVNKRKINPIMVSLAGAFLLIGGLVYWYIGYVSPNNKKSVDKNESKKLIKENNVTKFDSNIFITKDNYKKGKEYFSNKNYQKAVDHFEKLTVKHTNAQYFLGLSYIKLKNYKKAEKWLKLSADANKSDAQYALGVFYFENENYKEGEMYLTLAANTQNVDAQFDLGLFYREQGSEKKAEEWLRKSADNGKVEAFYVLALLYIRNYGNKKEGKKWLEKASALGHKEAKKMLKDLNSL